LQLAVLADDASVSDAAVREQMRTMLTPFLPSGVRIERTRYAVRVFV
jgi:hypothetical protein